MDPNNETASAFTEKETSKKKNERWWASQESQPEYLSFRVNFNSDAV